MDARVEISQSEIVNTKRDKLRNTVFSNARLNGNNPTKLMTNILAQESVIATASANILDDKDLKERLGMLE